MWQAGDPGHAQAIEDWVRQNGHASIVAVSPQAGMLATLGGTSQQLAMSDAPQLELWDVTGPAHPLASLTSSIGGIMTAAISPDGKLLAAASDTAVSLWDISDPGQPAALATLTFGSSNVEPSRTWRSARTAATSPPAVTGTPIRSGR